MGFLDKLLNKETKKLINTVADRVTDVVKNAVSETGSYFGNSAANTPMKNIVTGSGEEDCCHDAALVCSRIQTILAENFSGCELRKQIPASEIGAANIAWQYTYGVYRDGYAIAMINILDNPNDYRRKIVLQSKQVCVDHGIGYVHFLLHLPNRSSYILEQLKKIIPV